MASRTALNNDTLVRPVICHSIYHCTLPVEYIGWVCENKRYFTVKQHYFVSNVIKKEKVKHRLHVETIFIELESCMTIDRVACL